MSELKAFVRNGLKKVEEHNEGQKVLPKSETIIEWLDISEDEQRELITLKSKKIKQENNNAQRREKRRNDEGLTPKQAELKKLKVKILELKEKGLNNSEIARKLNIDRKKVSRLVNS